VEALDRFSTYTTVSGISDEFLINIDDYGIEKFELGNNIGVKGSDMAKIVAEKISSVNVGGYNFAEVEYTDERRLKIYSGSVGLGSTVTISYSAAAVALGFYKSTGESNFISINGSNPATGFDYASSRLLTATELNRLVDNKKDTAAYTHDPLQYAVEGGRRDFFEMGTSRLLSDGAGNFEYQSFENAGYTIVDLSHPFNNNGRITKVYVYGRAVEGAKIKILRPKRNGSLKVIHSLDFPEEDLGNLYSTQIPNSRIDFDILVNKGDLLGVYNVDMAVGASILGVPDATFYQLLGDVTGEIIPDAIHSLGVSGFAIYARGERYQNNFILDIDLGDRVNIEEFNIYGKETTSYFELNLASCLDINWQANTFNGTHVHTGSNAYTLLGWTEIHTNLVYRYRRFLSRPTKHSSHRLD
jgi:hypothetical protein